jgi:hypothetical protein
MTFLATQAALEQPRDLTGLEHQASSFADLTFPRHAPWLYSALSKLWDLEHGGRLNAGVGDLRITANTAIRVRQLLSKIGRIKFGAGYPNSLPAPSLNVFSGGGITVKWRVGPRAVKYSIWPEGTLTYWQENQGTEVEVNDDETPVEMFDPKDTVTWLLTP